MKNQEYEKHIRTVLEFHLGSPQAADAWLNSRDTEFPSTALESINAGKGQLVLDHLYGQFGGFDSAPPPKEFRA